MGGNRSIFDMIEYEAFFAAQRGEKMDIEPPLNAVAGAFTIDHGDHYEVVIRGLRFDKDGNFTVTLEDLDLKVGSTPLSGLPLMSATFSKEMFINWMRSGRQDIKKLLVDHIMNQVVQKIKQSPPETHALYKRAFFIAKEKHKDKQLRSAQLKAGKIISNVQIKAEKLRSSYETAYKEAVSAQTNAEIMITKAEREAKKFRVAYTNFVGNQNQTGAGDDDMDMTIAQNVTVEFKEALVKFEDFDVEKHISSLQVKGLLKAGEFIQLERARISAQGVDIAEDLFPGGFNIADQVPIPRPPKRQHQRVHIADEFAGLTKRERKPT